jgi:transposase InsO family protein
MLVTQLRVWLHRTSLRLGVGELRAVLRGHTRVEHGAVSLCPAPGKPKSLALSLILHAYDSVAEARAGLTRYIDFYNTARPHSSLDKKTPDEFYFATLPAIKQAA